ncbi:DegT/DnrJ/EryC1/StrS family aminotransferase [Azospirillum doebereinerae]|uniref:DegT/DnrJ/EryC1/StrS aminotransferase n=1 Tax=Azospirillum doebereinerae TaxID=92933 RepID=A0A3S0V5L8_9PROT|nr:DegT/DnrJ/EryC1/StrS family aminotransferase [Azospirillum doebereinerae]RUQ68851.1 DegT/DnrJ/EryC1/StrS aminotransferase [Azospirillum doebereinerae]
MSDERTPPSPAPRPPEGFETPLHVGQLNLPAAEAFREAFDGIFDRRFFANHGPLEQRLDRELASLFGVRNAVSVVNATAALMLVLRALDLDGEVIVPSFTFPATVQAVVWAGLRPVFCDIDPQTQTLTAARVAPKIGPATAAVLGVHIWGRGCDPLELEALTASRGVKLVFDAAHAVGATFRGRRFGGFGNAEVFSFHATKILNGAEGGCITTDDDDLAARLRTMRSFHDTDERVPGLLRLNAKISEAQAAMTLLGLRSLDSLIEQNRHRYELYRSGIDGTPGIHFLDYAAGETSNHQFIVLSVSPAELGLSRDELLDLLQAKNVLARRYFFPGVHRTPPFCDEGMAELPITDHLCQTLVQLPSGQAVTDADVKRVCAIIRWAATPEGRMAARA